MRFNPAQIGANLSVIPFNRKRDASILLPSWIDDKLEEEEQQIGDDVNLAPLPKRRRRARISEFPRILKRDVRREYSRLFVDAINSADEMAVQTFCESFCVQSVRMVTYACLSNKGLQYALDKQCSASKFALRSVNGVSTMIERIIGDMGRSPDMTCQIRDVEIRQRLNTPGSKLVIRARVQGTRISESLVEISPKDQPMYTIPSLWYHRLLTGKLPEGYPSVDAELNNANDIQTVFQTIETQLSKYKLHFSPYQIDFCAKLSFFLDNDHRIYRFELEKDEDI